MRFSISSIEAVLVTSLVSYLNKGSRRPNIQNVLFQIYVELLKNNIILVPKWASRNTRAIQQADTGSKLFLKRSDEFGVAQNQFLDIFGFLTMKEAL